MYLPRNEIRRYPRSTRRFIAPQSVAVFGSWARGEAGPSSDVDVLIVVAPEVEITRSLYTPWDGVDSQEVVELALKGLLRSCGVSPPRVYDVSDVLVAERERLPPAAAAQLDRMVSVSRRLRRDRELAFYGAEDLTPSGFYTEEDARAARTDAEDLVGLIAPLV